MDRRCAMAQGEIDSMLEIVSETGEGHGGHGGGNTKTEPSPKPSEGTTEGGNMTNMPGMKH